MQLDVKFIEPINGVRKKHYPFTAIDDCTRLRVLKIYDRVNQRTAIQFVDYVLEKLPFEVLQVQTDNGAEFQAAFHWHLLDRGIRHVYIRPSTPRLNGKVERSHRIDDARIGSLLTVFQLPTNMAEAAECDTERFARLFRAFSPPAPCCLHPNSRPGS